jgi:uncharacterized protein (TIGR02996 family)
MLDAALAQVNAGDLAAARDTLIAHWQKTRSPASADLVDLLEARVPDALTKELAAVVTPRVASSEKNLAALDGTEDPRLSRFALKALANPPFCAVSGEPFLLALAEHIARLQDARLKAELPRIRDILRARLSRKPMYERVAKKLDAIAARLPATPPRDSLEEKLHALLAPSGDAGALLAAIYAEPDDDAPRQVYADFLMKQGDPRGELIALQLARARGADPSDREVELLEAHGKKWLGPLATVLRWGKSYSATTFERGFVCVADFIDNAAKKVALIADDPAWATVETLDGGWPNMLLQRAPLRALRELKRSLIGDVWDALSQRTEPLRITTIHLGDGEPEFETIRRVLPRAEHGIVSLQTVTAAQIARHLDLDLRTLTVRSWYCPSPSLAAAKRAFATELQKLEGMATRVPTLIVSGPFSQIGTAQTVTLVRDESGTLRRRS